jgi:signal transduction histidine kinase
MSPAQRPPLLLLLIAGSLAIFSGLALAAVLLALEGLPVALAREAGLEARAAADGVEAELAALRVDVETLARDPAITSLVAGSRRPAAELADLRAAAELPLLRLMARHRGAAALALRDPAGGPLLLLARRDGIALLLSPEEDPPAPIADPGLVVTQTPVPAPDRQRGLIELWIAAEEVLAAAAPGFAGKVVTVAEGPADPEGASRQALARDPLWSPPIAWRLVRDPLGRREGGGIAGFYRGALIAHLALLAGVLLLGALGLREALRAARLGADRRHQARLRELERQVTHAERLASVGRLAAAVAHEVNNPLAGTANYLTMAQEDLAAGRSAEAADLIVRARQGVDRVGDLTRRLLSLSAPPPMSRQPLDLRQAIEQAAALAAAGQADPAPALDLHLGETPLTVRGDLASLTQLFLNLLLNAVQAGSRRIEVTADAEAPLARIEVADDGPGLAPEVRDRLFEAFVSTRGSTGLGLAICRGIVEEHGGRIAGGTRPGGGTRFTVELPLLADRGPR